MNQSATACQAIVKKENDAYPDLNLHGLTLQEYLMLQAAHYIQEKANIPTPQTAARLIDSATWPWLLEEVSADKARCLGADWHPGARSVRVDSRGVGGVSGDGGARLAAAVPK